MFGKLKSRPDWQIALAMTGALRVFYSAVAAASLPFLHPDPVLIHSNELTENLAAPYGLHYALLGIWERFDTLWFLHIAEHGYDRPMAVIFYPLYPAAIRLVSGLIPPMAAALLVSTVAAFFPFWGLLRLASESSEVVKFRTLLLFCMWPTSFVLFAGYAESLTLALVVWAVIFGRKARWEAATACGLLAGSARPSGVLVLIPLAIMALRSRQVRSLIVALTPLGLLSYWGWLRWSGRPSVVQAYRLYQGMTMVPPWRGLEEALWLIVTEHDTLLAIKLGLVILVTVITLRGQVRIEDKAFALAVILQMFMYTGRPLLGAARYVLMVYPAFIVFGAHAERWNGKQFGFYVAALSFLNLTWMWAFLSWSLVL
jgi:Mannosyltransferase (PIG-V)